MTRRPFTRIEEIRLVSSIRRFPQIYDYKHKEYRNQDLRDDIWSRISRDVGRNVEDCKKRWRSIRDTNNRLKRAEKVLGKKNPSKWILADQLDFLQRKELSERAKKENPIPPTVSNEILERSKGKKNESEEFEFYEEDEMRPPAENVVPVHVPVLKTKPSVYVYETKRLESELRENVYHGREEKSDRDPVNVFFKSMALSVKRLPPVLIAEAKSKICKIVTDLEIRALLSPSEVVSVVTQDHYQEVDDIKNL